MVNYSQLIGRAFEMMLRPSVVIPPLVERRRRLQDGISQIQNIAAVELGFRGAPRWFQGTGVYIGGRSRSVDARGAHEGWGAPGTLVAASFTA